MLSLVELSRAVAAVASRFVGLSLEHLVLADERLLLRFAGRLGGGESRVRRRLVIVADRARSRVAETEDGPAPEVATQPPFAQYLRAHLSHTRLASVDLVGSDRIAALRFVGREERHTLLLQILGPRSNLYLLDDHDRIETSLRPLEETRRELARGEAWRAPASAPPRAGDDRFADVPEDGLLVAIEQRYESVRDAEGGDERRRRFATLLDRELGALARRIHVLRLENAREISADELSRRGELLKSVLHRVPTRASEIELQDPMTGVRTRLALDPRLPAAQNVALLFEESRRVRLRGERVAVEITTLGERLAAVRVQRERLDAIASEEAAATELDALAGSPPLRDLLRRTAPQPPPQARPRSNRGALPARLRPKRYRSHDGLEIWVGKNDDGNDHLTTRLARGNDLFLHVEGGAGSHVVLRTEGRKDVPTESMLEACELAAHFSKQRGAGRTDVLIAAIKDVSKPRGTKRGLVHVRGGRTVHLRRDPARLAAVLERRIEDEQ